MKPQWHAFGQCSSGTMFQFGRGVQQNHTEAVKWYRKAVEQGHAQRQNNLGIMYANGRGVKQDHSEAVKWYRKAAEQGRAIAMRTLESSMRMVQV